MKNELKNKDNFIIYTTDDNNIDIEVYLENENLWMTQDQINVLRMHFMIMSDWVNGNSEKNGKKFLLPLDFYKKFCYYYVVLLKEKT